ncbi:hypothetical protein ACFQ3R_14110 [Mesonia ostreae]|uniref:Outer membrane protein beta-barrel domain-containing protein n=1 Tax=Mesonia ostreae TaxID=861110 RepID=A0ABU2KMA0_9FLAO|nr:hypothetical protein [Mesonia ostreae]MDT0295850.1 hypothetical protein [Mesonia ostreae]
MKSYLTLLFALCIFHFSSAQENYTYQGETYSLIKTVDGELDLLYNVIDGEYRYFISKNGELEELVNTKIDGKYNKQYKSTLERLTNDQEISTERINLTLGSLENFIVEYNNTLKDEDFIDSRPKPSLNSRLGFFGGISNMIYTPNPTNETAPVLGAEWEVYSNEKLKRHSAFVQLRYVFESEDYKYSEAEFSLNYRFKVVDLTNFHFYLEAELFNLTFYNENYILIDSSDSSNNEKINRTGSEMNFPINFGAGVAYRITPNGFLTLSYNDVVSIAQDNNGEFPVDITLGYKFKL